MKKIPWYLIILNFSITLSQTNYLDFLPLQVGNVWVYQCQQSGYPPPICGFCFKRIKVKITNTSVIDGKTFYHGQMTEIHISGICSGCSSNLLNFSSNLRIDSLNANVLEYSLNGGCAYRPNEILRDSLKARLFDSIWLNCQPPTQWSGYVCSDTNNITIFGQSRQSRSYSLLYGEGGWGRTFVKGIGLSASGSFAISCNNNSQLLGCVIGGIVYGDTGFMVGINKISSEVPESFALFQNYPNPFNPTTKIKFEIRNTKYETNPKTEIRIYDVLGREVTTLVNEALSPGTYEIEWDGTNYPSGVYYYALSVGEFKETKKMVLIK